MPKRFLNVQYSGTKTEIDVTEPERISQVQNAFKTFCFSDFTNCKVIETASCKKGQMIQPSLKSKIQNMGNYISSNHRRNSTRKHDAESQKEIYSPAKRIDGGQLHPTGLYANPTNNSEDAYSEILLWQFDLPVVQKLIVERRLAPFYHGLSDLESVQLIFQQSDCGKYQIDAASTLEKCETVNIISDKCTSVVKTVEAVSSDPRNRRPRSASAFIRATFSASLFNGSTKRIRAQSNLLHDQQQLIQHSDISPNPERNADNLNCIDEQQKQRYLKEIYQSPVECPICFLIHPANINYTQCCAQPICTECFVEIKRSRDFSEARCPYCVENRFGIRYQAYSFDAEGTTGVEDKSIVYSDDIRPKLLCYIEDRQRSVAEAAHRAELETRRRQLFIRESPAYYGSSRYHQRHTHQFPIIMIDSAAQELEDLMVDEAIRRSMFESDYSSGNRSISSPVIHAEQSSESDSSNGSELDEDEDDNTPIGLIAMRQQSGAQIATGCNQEES